MQINLKRKIIIIVLLATSNLSFANDTLHVNSFNSIRLLKSNNPWLGTGNIAGLVFNQPGSTVAFETRLDQGDGNFHRIREASNYHNYSFSTQSFQSSKDRMFLFGKFEYHYVDDFGGKWNGTYDPYRGNPYVLADSVSGTNYHKENYNLAGGIGFKMNDQISLGCALDYYVGVGAKQKDPRPENTFVQFSINPSIILNATNYKLGFDIGFTNRKEEIKYDVMRNNYSPVFFMFKGFGFYSVDIDSNFSRFLSANEFFGGIQFEKSLRGIPTLTEIRFNFDIEQIDDGGSVIRKMDGGEWKTYNLNLKEQFNVKNGLSIHRFKGNFSFFNGNGIEFTQNMVYEGTWNVPRYVTIGKNLKFKRQTLNGELLYNYQQMLDENRINWDLVTCVNFINRGEKYYFIPEIFSSDYSNLVGNLYVQKNFYFRNIHLAPSFNTSWTSNISNSILLSDLTEITKKQRKDVYLQEFDYYISDLFKVGGELKCGGKALKLIKGGQIYLSLRYDYYRQINGNLHFNVFNTILGFIF